MGGVRILPISLAIRTLRGESPEPRRRLSKTQAAEWLRNVSGEDFGEDAERWGEWLKKNRWAYYRSPLKKQG
jgi:hypothetical protein